MVKGTQIRTEILEYSLMLENFTSIFLAELLGIKEFKKTKSLGNKSGNLSFNQKIQLLIDIEAINSNERKKFITFMEIRNQFMHNIDALDYESCFSFLEGKSKFILKLYPQDEKIPTEKKLELATKELANEIISITVNLYEKVKEKIENKIKGEMLQKFQDETFETVKALEEGLNVFFEKKQEEGIKEMKLSEFKEFGSDIRKLFYRILGSKIKK